MDESNRAANGARPTGSTVRFGPYELDLRSAELRRNDRKVRLQEQPFLILAALLERPGEVVLREELRNKLWPDNTVVEFDHGINAAVKRLREALGESVEKPRYIETLARKGYRFIGKVEAVTPIQLQPPVERETPAANPFAEGPDKVVFESPNLPGDSAASFLPSPVKPRARIALYAIVFLGLTATAIAGVLLWKNRVLSPNRLTVVRFTKLTSDGLAKAGPLLTDGLRLYFEETRASGQKVIVQISVRGGDTAVVPVPLRQPTLLDLSRDGTELLVKEEQGYDQPQALWRQPLAGGSPRRVGGVLVSDAAFGPSESGIIYSNGHDAWFLPTDDASPRRLLTVVGAPGSFRFSADAKSLRFTQVDDTTDARSLMEANADGTGLRTMFEGCCGEWTRDRRFYIFEKEQGNRSNLWAAPVAGSHLQPAALTAGPLNFQSPAPSRDGMKLFAIGTAPQSEVVRFDAKSRKFEPYLGGISAECVTFSADGKWVAYTSYPDAALWRSRPDGTERRQLTFAPMRVFMPRWSPDGEQIVFNAHLPNGVWNIYSIAIGGGNAQHILPSNLPQMDANWSPDGTSLVLMTGDRHLAIVNLDLKSGRVTPVDGSDGMFSPHWSPDGRYICAINGVDHHKLMLFDLAAKKWTEGGAGAVGYPTWSHDGKYLYFEYTPPGADIFRIARLRVSDRKLEIVAEIASLGRLTVGTFGHWFGLAADDSPLLARDISAQEVYALDMVDTGP